MKLCNFDVGLDQPLFLIAGPCMAESLELCIDVAGQMKDICDRLVVPYIFKASYDKANRSSGKSARGPGLEDGLNILAEVRRQIGVPVLTDVHTVEDIGEGSQRRRGYHHGLRTRCLIRLQQPRVGHAFARDHASDILSGRIRRDAFSAIAWWTRDRFRWSN